MKHGKDAFGQRNRSSKYYLDAHHHHSNYWQKRENIPNWRKCSAAELTTPQVARKYTRTTKAARAIQPQKKDFIQGLWGQTA